MTLRRMASLCRLLGLALLILLARLAHAEEPRPLTTTILRELARTAGIGQGLTGVQLNRAIGLAFQDVALRAFNQPENKDPFQSPLRARATQKLAASWQSVVPDGVRTAILLPEGLPGQLFPESVFFEAKATRYPLTLASRNWQILGLIDAASRSPGGRTSGIGAALFFLTTADTEIAPEVLATARLLHVVVWQRKAVGRAAAGKDPARAQAGYSQLVQTLALAKGIAAIHPPRTHGARREMKDPKKRMLTAQQVCNLLAQGRFERVEELSMPLAGMAFYKDDRGGALLILSKTKKPGVYFDSYDEYVAFEHALATSEPHHMLWRMIPEGERFPETIPQKLDELAHALGLPRDALDFSHKSFGRLDRIVARSPHRYLEADRFPLLVAYAGEAIRHRKSGRWEMTLYHDGETWQPEIVLPDGTRRNPYVSLYKGLLEWGGRGTLSGTLEALAEVWRLEPGPPATEGA